MQEGVEGLRRDKTPPSRIPPLGAEVAERVVALTQGNPPGETLRPLPHRAFASITPTGLLTAMG
jgi:hypothetical protein